MFRSIATIFIVLIGVSATTAFGQEAREPARLEITYMPAGAAYVMEKDDSPSFGNYGFGTSVTYNLNRYFGIEGEIGTMISTTSDLQFGDLDSDAKAPNFLNYTANLVVSPWTGSSFVPYGSGGLGGLTMFERPEVGVTGDETFLSTNFGGGLKWFAGNGQWGLRGDYRFGMTKSKDSAPEFFGRESRTSHRFYVGVIINTLR